MKTYLVRTVETAHVVGIFCAQTSVELFRLVDEQVDPEDCEYLELKSGEGMFFEGQFLDVPLDEEDEDGEFDVDVDSINPLDEAYGVQMTSNLYERMNGEEGVTDWHLFTDDDIQKACEEETTA